MAWYFTNGELYSGETHVLAGNTFSGKTRTSESRRLVEGPDPKPKPEPKPRAPKPPLPKGATAWD